MKLWDPHFHIWDVAAGMDDAGYGLAGYERDVSCAGFELIGGTFVEVMSARHAGVAGQGFADACAAEADWVSRQLGGGRLPYVMVASAPLEYEGVPALLQQLAADERVRGGTADHQPRALIEGWRTPFDAELEGWRPDPAWSIPLLPAGWEAHASETHPWVRVPSK